MKRRTKAKGVERKPPHPHDFKPQGQPRQTKDEPAVPAQGPAKGADGSEKAAAEEAPRRKRKIAILGGGVGAMAAAYTLTSQPGWEHELEVTVYQRGWRLGGKGASGRNVDPDKGNRIEEHGIHVWLGCYQNAFAMMRRCYAELGRPAGTPLAQWTDAFEPWPDVGVIEQVTQADGIAWVPWIEHFRVNDQIPGDHDAPSIWNMAAELVGLMFRVFSTAHASRTPCCADALPAALRPLFDAVTLPLTGTLEGLAAVVEKAASVLEFEGAALNHAAASGSFRKVEDLVDDGPGAASDLLTLVEKALAWFKGWAEPLLDADTAIRRTFIFLDFGIAMLRGVIKENVFAKGFSVLDKYDLREFLRINGADPITYDSALVGGTYDFPFADRQPGTGEANLAAGAIIRGMWLTMFGYSGSMFYKMMAGMGDVVFAPLYLVLKRRGVRFEFFHEVTALHTRADRDTPAAERHVDAIRLRVQMKPKHGAYDPLVEVNGLACWPSEPTFDLLHHGPELREGLRDPKKNYDLESFWNDWPAERQEEKTLERGEDFDAVVLGIAIGALEDLCGSLIRVDPRWEAMIERVPTAPTFGVQLWLNPSSESLGWPVQVIADNFAEPLGTWADMSHLLRRETWAASGPASSPGSIAYFCGTLGRYIDEMPPRSDHLFPRRAEHAVRRMAHAWFDKNADILWGPNATTEARPTALNPWILFHPDPDAAPRARFEWQFFRANVDPSERYVNTPAGSTRYRLAAGDSGFVNLAMAGDWTKTVFDLGCVEAAVVSGMQAARAIRPGPHVDIINENLA